MAVLEKATTTLNTPTAIRQPITLKKQAAVERSPPIYEVQGRVI